MGVPHFTAPSEAEAQCAELVKKGLCYGVGTEDMDALTFGTNVSFKYISLILFSLVNSVTGGRLLTTPLLRVDLQITLAGHPIM